MRIVRHNPAGALLLAACAAALTLPGCGGGESGGGSGGAPAPAPEAHVLLVTADTLRADHLDAYGDTAVDTPNLDALLASSVVYRNSWTVVPITTPSLGSLLTSRMPRNHGALNNGYDLSSPDPTIPMALKESGWRTAAFLPTFLADKTSFRRGFDIYEHPGVGEPYLSGEELVRRATAFMDQVEADGESWFVWVHLLEPHSPYAPGAELEAKYLPEGAVVEERMRDETYGESMQREEDEVEIVRGLYRGDVELTDRYLGPLFDRTARSDGKVVTVFTADHGEMLYEHVNYIGHACWLHEPILRVPLAIHVSDGSLPAGTRDDPVSQLDVAPTLLALLGGSFESRDGGLNLLAGSAPDDRLIVHETFAPEAFRYKMAVRSGDWKLQRASRAMVRGSTATDYRLIIDLAADPTESSVADPAAAGAKFAELLTAFDAWAATQTDPMSHRSQNLDAETRKALEALGYAQGAIRPDDAKMLNPR
ncbi:MAG: sulfatase [Planctomycetota bacterium]